MAYIDQLKLGERADNDLIDEPEVTIGEAKAVMENGGPDRGLARDINHMACKARRVNEDLAETLERIGGSLRD